MKLDNFIDTLNIVRGILTAEKTPINEAEYNRLSDMLGDLVESITNAD